MACCGSRMKSLHHHNSSLICHHCPYLVNTVNHNLQPRVMHQSINQSINQSICLSVSIHQCLRVKATLVRGVAANRPSVIDVSLMFTPHDSDTAVLVMSAPMTFGTSNTAEWFCSMLQRCPNARAIDCRNRAFVESNNDRTMIQSFSTCESIYAATLNRFVDVGSKLGEWEVIVTRAQNAGQLTALLEVTVASSMLLV
jgi:DNA mismatch repair ATPase MutL